jgi:hypothetical protein
MDSKTKLSHWEETNVGLGKVEESDDFLHPLLSTEEPGYQLSETHYFGFNIPEHSIQGFGTCWYHPHLKTLMGGVGAWQGFKSHPLQSEIWDVLFYMPDSYLAQDNRHYKLENGYEVTTLQPLVAHRLQYENKKTDSWLDLTMTALMPPVMLGTGYHFDQAMKVKGEVRLRGKTYSVASNSVRDRSFGQLRYEHHQSVPPLAWMNCGFSETLCFCCTAFDDPRKNPSWAGVLSVPGDNPLRSGWIYRDGVASDVVAASKTCTRKPGVTYPDKVELTITDRLGRTLEITGQSMTGVNWAFWSNCDSNICLMRWECEGQVGYGDYQEFMWTEYIRHFHP